MREVFVAGNGLVFFSVGYLYPFIVVFRGGTLGERIGHIWAFSVAFFLLITIAVPRIVNVFDPLLAEEIDRSWTPDMPALVPLVCCGWMMPVCSGAIGHLARRLSLAWFPEVMRRISLPESTHSPGATGSASV